jgi:DNA polymerase-3 subunit gamma/tau
LYGDPGPEAPPYGELVHGLVRGSQIAQPDEPLHGRTDVHIHADVQGQPIDVSATLPGAGHVTAQEAQRAAEHMADEVSHALATEADPTPTVTATATVDPAAAAPAPSLELSLDRLGESWPAILEELREGTPMLAAALDDCAPAKLSDDGLTLAWPETSSFLKRKAEDPANKELLVKAIRSVTGSSLRLAYELRSESDPVPTVMANAPSAPPKLTEDDLVQRFMEEFDAEELPPDPEEQT